MRRLGLIRYPSPIGEITCLFDTGGLCYLDFSENDDRLRTLLTRRFGAEHRLDPISGRADIENRLDRYFFGDPDAFCGLQLVTGGTRFQQKVWNSLGNIAPGTTLSYSQLAASVGRPTAIRAVASANARNPIAIIVPCHRVIGADGSLRGYAGGLDRKAWLLRHEGVDGRWPGV